MCVCVSRMMIVTPAHTRMVSGHGQKGTIGMVVPDTDMPWSESGISPDLIVNPNAIPSRMTVGQLVECILGKAGAIDGRRGNGTAFRGVTVDEIGDRLKYHGMDPWGDETMYCGRTGVAMTCRVFMGPTFYQRLRHMVQDKIHSRARGGYTMLCRQPLEGRSKGGGLRFGEMERDALAAHGTSAVMKDRMLHSSDAFDVQVCQDCGCMCDDICRKCGHGRSMKRVTMPYATKLLFQELGGLHIDVRVRL